ncbi:MAG: WD40 repeat domain-containing protein [Proteobacteria bacterium]|nr:WD40 repeat domain-containing protein [Pseudomonadota bacterium]
MSVEAATDSALAGAQRTAWRFEAFVTAIAVDTESRTAAFGLGSGRVRLVDFTKQQAHAARTAEAHGGALLALAADPTGGFVSGGDDGRVVRIARDGAAAELARFAGQWVEHVAALADGRVAAAVGRTVHVVGDGAPRTLGPHPSTVSGLAHVGARLAVAHYGGVSLWDPDAAADAAPDLLPWKGSHLCVAPSPDGQFIATATQDHALHVWRLENRTDMQMAGYPTKVASLSWSSDSLRLAASGANNLSAWPFDGPGPEGREPIAFLDGKDALATRVAFHPRAPLLAGGFSDGTLAVVDTARRRAIKIPLSKGVAVSALAWSPDGRHVVAGAEDGRAAIVSLAAGGTS